MDDWQTTNGGVVLFPRYPKNSWTHLCSQLTTTRIWNFIACESLWRLILRATGTAELITNLLIKMYCVTSYFINVVYRETEFKVFRYCHLINFYLYIFSFFFFSWTSNLMFLMKLIIFYLKEKRMISNITFKNIPE